MDKTQLSYLDSDFREMKWNILEVPTDKNILDEVPQLGAIFKNCKPIHDIVGISTNQLVRYVVYAYHFYSPIARKDNLLERKRDALIYSGIPCDDKGNYPLDVMSIVKNENGTANLAILHFLKSENRLDWIELQSKLSLYYEVLSMMISQSETAGTKTIEDVMSQKVKVSSMLKQVKADIDELKAKLFIGDSTLINLVNSFEELENELVLYPEQYVVSKLKNLSVS